MTNGTATGTTITDASANDVIILNYDGAIIPNFVITATSGGKTLGSGTVTVL